MPSAQTLSEEERRLLALWAADCSERVLPLLREGGAGPLGSGLLTSGALARTVREIQASLPCCP